MYSVTYHRKGGVTVKDSSVNESLRNIYAEDALKIFGDHVSEKDKTKLQVIAKREREDGTYPNAHVKM